MKPWLQAAILLVSSASLAAFAQAPSPPDTTLAYTGCLESGSPGYRLSAGGLHLDLTGDVDFAEHVGRTVKVTGEQSGKSFSVAAIESVSMRCESVESAETEGRDEQKAPEGLTAQDQGDSQTDRDTTARIRKALVEDDSLSMAAHNIKIITREGRVTLRGQVRSTQEKAAVAAKAEAALGAAVDNQLTVQPQSK